MAQRRLTPRAEEEIPGAKHRLPPLSTWTGFLSGELRKRIPADTSGNWCFALVNRTHHNSKHKGDVVFQLFIK